MGLVLNFPISPLQDSLIPLSPTISFNYLKLFNFLSISSLLQGKLCRCLLHPTSSNSQASIQSKTSILLGAVARQPPHISNYTTLYLEITPSLSPVPPESLQTHGGVDLANSHSRWGGFHFHSLPFILRVLSPNISLK